MRPTTRLVGGGLAALALALALSACGSSGGSGTPTTPTPNPGGGGTPTPTTTITITASGANPRSITVAPGTRVTFMNSDSRPHDMASNPHPEHTDCPSINDVGFLSAGQSRTTGNLNTVRTCGYHDHNDPLNTGLQGTIQIQ